ncbi:hypothetical protein A5687_08870 [Mycobacterium mantenii]|uniref:DUF732 domain-containing protein n=1 Tax=Mycobacterium mantenii TaxID=560555 RepID=UPI0008007659|nr:DUF732 domain-containing protein [Mycobacterium mantenii]OBH52475.1 hypothetical protein A5687_08870 [Mycobacterium mantenii]
MRDREKIDSELRLIALRRQAIREQGGQPSSLEADALLDEILAHGAGMSGVDAVEDWEAEFAAAAAPTRDGATRTLTRRRRTGAALRRVGLFAALPLSLVAAVAAVVVMFALHRSDTSAQPEDPPPSAAPSTPVAPKASAPAVDAVDSAFVAALRREGVPVPSQEYVTNQGHAVCDFLTHQPSFADAVGFVQRNSIWDADQSAKVTAGAIVSYCPKSRPTGPDPMQPDYQKSLSDLQDIERNLQGIQGNLQDIQGGLDKLPGHP